MAALVGAAALPLVEACGDDSSPAVTDASDAAPDVTLDQSVPEGTNLVDAARDAGAGDTSAPSDASADADAVLEPFFDCTQDAAAGVALPHDLRCTGLYDRWTQKTIAATAQSYKPAYVLWSDGADKRRWIYLPAGSQIDSTNMDSWVFPVGTKVWKEFAFSGVPVETRLYQKIAVNSWLWTTYVWSVDGTAAVANDDGVGADAGGDAGYAGYEIPSHDKCTTCHKGGSDSLLGFEAVLLGASGATGLTLAQLKQKNLLTTNPTTTTVVVPNELTGKDAKSLGWLQANCGVSCHNATGTCAAHAHFKMVYSDLVHADGGTDLVTDLESYTTTVNVPAAFPAGDNRINPGDPSTSAVYILVNQRNAVDPLQNQMPWIDSHKVDTADVADLNAWITALP